jgi:K+-sensing histidine kinase KdpD
MQGSDVTLDRATLASAVHDLRNPLAVILGMASVLRARAMPRDKDCLDAIAVECGRLSRMVDNLMAASRMGMAPAREWLPADELASQSIARLESVLGGTSIALDVEAGVLVHVEPMLGELLLVNVLEAVAGPPDGRLELLIRRDNGGTVIDVRGSIAFADDRSLPLMIAQQIASVHGGTLEALDPSGGGSLIRIKIPDAAERPAPVEVTP